jgi:hypothetical protein
MKEATSIEWVTMEQNRRISKVIQRSKPSSGTSSGSGVADQAARGGAPAVEAGRAGRCLAIPSGSESDHGLFRKRRPEALTNHPMAIAEDGAGPLRNRRHF